MHAELTIFNIDVAGLFVASLLGLFPALPGVDLRMGLNALVLAAGGYVLGACVCRLRFGTGSELRWSWALLYLSVAGCVALLMLAATQSQARFVDGLIATTLAAYFHMTAHVWRPGVAPVAAVSAPSQPFEIWKGPL